MGLKTLDKENFKDQILEALSNYDKYIICLSKTTPDMAKSAISLLEKAIAAYLNRGDKKNGIALDKYVTIILTEAEDSDIPKCSIYFNLSSAYAKKITKK